MTFLDQLFVFAASGLQQTTMGVVAVTFDVLSYCPFFHLSRREYLREEDYTYSA